MLKLKIKLWAKIQKRKICPKPRRNRHKKREGTTIKLPSHNNQQQQRSKTSKETQNKRWTTI